VENPVDNSGKTGNPLGKTGGDRRREDAQAVEKPVGSREVKPLGEGLPAPGTLHRIRKALPGGTTRSVFREPSETSIRNILHGLRARDADPEGSSGLPRPVRPPAGMRREKG